MLTLNLIVLACSEMVMYSFVNIYLMPQQDLNNITESEENGRGLLDSDWREQNAKLEKDIEKNNKILEQLAAKADELNVIVEV